MRREQALIVPPATVDAKDLDAVRIDSERDHDTTTEPDRPQPGPQIVP